MKKRLLFSVTALLSALALVGCAGQQLADYKNEKPTLDLATYFNGPLEAHGIFQDRSGKVVKRFIVKMEGRWTGNKGVLDEHFTYSDGTKERRVWHLEKLADGRYTGTASDVEGQAQGQISGNAFNWQYTLKLPVDGKTYSVQFDDWMYLMDDRVMLNRATMSKFGIKLGEVTLSFYKS